MSRHSSHILELAKRGAQHRFSELKAELADLVKAFPHLEYGSATSHMAPRPMRYEPAPVKRRRRTMSAAARKAVSERMKKYWAARRKAKKSK